uniref:Uncharacterized protein n=1 Tax=Arundo donax TaxID=35708 RepID=A0A0A9HP14_ARUDO
MKIQTSILLKSIVTLIGTKTVK